VEQGWELTKSTVEKNDVIGHLKQAIEGARSRGIPVLFGPMAYTEEDYTTEQLQRKSGINRLMFERKMFLAGSWGADFHPDLQPREELIEYKNPELAMKLEHTKEWEQLSVNHLEGRTAAFYCYGNGGGDEIDDNGRPKVLLHTEYFDPEQEPFDEVRNTYAPLVWQCRYSGIEVPDHLWRYTEFGKDKKYSDNQAEHMATEPEVFRSFDAWTASFADFVNAKGKVQPGKYRAFRHQSPGHKLADAKLAWRSIRMKFGMPPEGSSPAKQQDAGLNQDATLSPKKGEGEKLRAE